jgi:hypothetical protein
VAHFLESALSPWATATTLCIMLLPACGQGISPGVWQQVQRLHSDILAAVLRASFLPPAINLKHAPPAYQAAVCSSALDVRYGLGGFILDGMSFRTCFDTLSSMPELQWMKLWPV